MRTICTYKCVCVYMLEFDFSFEKILHVSEHDEHEKTSLVENTNNAYCQNLYFESIHPFFLNTKNSNLQVFLIEMHDKGLTCHVPFITTTYSISSYTLYFASIHRTSLSKTRISIRYCDSIGLLWGQGFCFFTKVFGDTVAGLQTVF